MIDHNEDLNVKSRISSPSPLLKKSNNLKIKAQMRSNSVVDMTFPATTKSALTAPISGVTSPNNGAKGSKGEAPGASGTNDNFRHNSVGVSYD